MGISPTASTRIATGVAIAAGIGTGYAVNSWADSSQKRGDLGTNALAGGIVLSTIAGTVVSRVGQRIYPEGVGGKNAAILGLGLIFGGIAGAGVEMFIGD